MHSRVNTYSTDMNPSYLTYSENLVYAINKSWNFTCKFCKFKYNTVVKFSLSLFPRLPVIQRSIKP